LISAASTSTAAVVSTTTSTAKEMSRETSSKLQASVRKSGVHAPPKCFAGGAALAQISDKENFRNHGVPTTLQSVASVAKGCSSGGSGGIERAGILHKAQHNYYGGKQDATLTFDAVLKSRFGL